MIGTARASAAAALAALLIGAAAATGATSADAVRPQPEMSGMRAPAAAQASCAPDPGETVGARTGSAVVLVNASVRQPEELSGDSTVTVCLKPSGRRVLVGTVDPVECWCRLNPSIVLPRSSDRWSAFVVSFPIYVDFVVVIDTHSGRFQRLDQLTCGTCAPGPAIPSLAVGPSGAVAWVVDDRELKLVGPGGFDLFLHATGRTRLIDRRARSISDLRVGKTAVTWRDAGRPRRLRLS